MSLVGRRAEGTGRLGGGCGGEPLSLPCLPVTPPARCPPVGVVGYAACVHACVAQASRSAGP